MNGFIFILPLLAVLAAGSPLSLVFAETFDIKIPFGASDPNAPFFWSETSTGITTGKITVYPGDSVTWHNADTAFHTITSVTPSGEEDGLFDSGFFTAGKSYTKQFDDPGDFYYYCSLHPYMSGIVHVVTNKGTVQSIPHVGSGYGEDGLGFEVKYILDANLQKDVHVNPDDKSLTFRISGLSASEQITIMLPAGLIENPNIVLVDGTNTSFEKSPIPAGSQMIFSLSAGSQEIKIIGTKVIPEFGFLALTVLSIGLVSTLFLARSRLSLIR